LNDYTGQQFGNYRLLRLLDSGGFADVYLGEHIYLHTSNAVKILQSHFFNAEEQQDFLREAQFIAHLHHPHIIQVQDFGLREGIPFLVMSYAPHGNLRQHHPEGTHVPLASVVAYVNQAASALQYAHHRQLIHRDIKPENLLLDEHDELLLSDFGIAIIARSSRSQSLQAVVGTVTYMAPEQIQGRPRPASDQYALAALAYEWLSGAPPFEGESAIDIAGKHLYTPLPPLPTRVPGLPPAVTAIMTTALAKDSRQRFESVQAFADALERASRFGTMPVPALQVSDSTAHVSEHDATPRREQPREGRRRISRRTALLGGSSIAALAAVGATYLGWLAHAPKNTLVARNMLLSPSPTLTPSPTVTPSSTVPISAIGDTVYVYTGHSDWVDTANWSPDGQRIVSASFDRTLQVWDAFTGQHQLKQHDYAFATGGEGAGWSPDGTSIASNRSDRTVRVWDVVTQQQKLSVSGNAPIAWSPNGHYLAIASGSGPVYVLNASTGGIIVSYRGHMNTDQGGSLLGVNTIAWSPDGAYLATGGPDGTVQVWNPFSGASISNFTGHITTGTSLVPGALPLSSTLHHPPAAVAEPFRQHPLTTPARPLSASAYVVYSLAWSPDSTHLASACADRTVQISDAMSGQHVLTYSDHTVNVLAVSWSPNGKRIVSGDAYSKIFLWEAATGQTILTYGRHQGNIYSVRWSPNGKFIASCAEDTTVQVWKATD
jgi:WD40 repeat protein